MKTLLIMCAIVLATSVAQVADAAVLWDQSTPDPSAQGFANSVGASGPWGINAYAVDDIRVHDVWGVDSYTLTYYGIDPNWAFGVFQATLSVFAKNGSVPTAADNPAAQILVPASAVSEVIDGNVVTTIVATGLNLELMPGDYWIGLTTNAPMAGFDWQGWRMSASPWGDTAAIYDANFGGPWISTTDAYGAAMDGCFTIEGTILAVPVSEDSFGELKSNYQR